MGSDFIVARPFKLMFLERRPEESCMKSWGMPSGHALQAISALTFLMYYKTRFVKGAPMGLGNMCWRATNFTL